MADPKKALEKKAIAASRLIHFFEEQGRTVTGVAIKGSTIHLDFGSGKQDDENSADLVRMDN